MCAADAIFNFNVLLQLRIDTPIQTILYNRLNLLNSPASSLETALLPATTTVKFHVVETISNETNTK